ncbi:MAG: distal tail protein Dit [Eubacterium sp.]
MFDFYLHGESAAGYGVYAVERPSVPAPQKRIEQLQVSGRDGILTIDDNTFDVITIPISCNFMAESAAQYHSTFRKIKSWILSEMQTSLAFSDDLECFYKVQSISTSNVSRSSKKIGSFSIDCICEPFQYLISGQEEIPFEIYEYEGSDSSNAFFNSKLVNEHYLAQPIYKLNGEGVFEIYVNDNHFKINVAQNCTIDTSLGIIYREDGTLINQSAQGNFEDLWLEHGESIITFICPKTSAKPTIIPNWRSL